MTFTFSIKGLVPLLKHSLHAKKHKIVYGIEGTAVPGLWLVKDEGVYLMSNGDPGLLKSKKKGSPNRVLYAEGHGPETFMGGDDYVELLGAGFLAHGIKLAQKHGGNTINVVVTEDSIRLRA